MALLEVDDVRVSFNTDDGVVEAVRGISFEVSRGQTLGIVGESGSGKSVATQTITGLTRGAHVTGRAVFEGTDLLTAGPEQLRKIRGAKIGMIFQDPLTSLHPLYSVGWQIVEMIRAHDKSTSKKQATDRAVELLTLVGIPNARGRVNDYPHQFSGGMRQRVMIAMAMALNPALLIADEPTTALDVTVQAQVLSVMRKVQEEFGTAIILITHDLGVVAEMADDIVVMYAGRMMEHASRRELFYHHHHPYTEGLLASLPSHLPSHLGESGRLTPIKGTPPSVINPPEACPFAPRCPYVFSRCLTELPAPEPVFRHPEHTSACFLSAHEEERERLRAELRERLVAAAEGAA
ncbi:MAG: ABC transporter ATP-binding protein [Nocardioidaceae bacterium]